jgi:lipopolysaccharide export system protein LptC
MTYSAQGVHLTQTDEQGNLYIRAEMKQLNKICSKNFPVDQLNAVMFKQGKPDATFYAKQAKGYDDNTKIVLMGDVVATKLSDQGNKMEFRTDELTGYPKTRELETQHQVTVQSPNSAFVSQGLKANLNNGQYEFFKVRGKYAPNS